MAKSRWIQVDRWMRSIHLYTGLFLVPWMLVYATSAFSLNHNEWITHKLGILPPKWEPVREVDFPANDGFPKAPDDRARAILQFLKLDGPHRIQGRPTPQSFVILRLCARGHYRITWRRKNSRLIVERQQPFSVYRLIHYLHFRCGYKQPYFAFLAWAVVVDTVSISLWFWVISGIYIWARRPSRRLAGGICLLTGGLLFLGLLALLCL